MSVTIVKFNVGGKPFEVAETTIQSQPAGLLAKMIDGRFSCGKDESGAYFLDRNPQFFPIVLDVHRDNKVHPLMPGFTRERVATELEYYGLQDFFDGTPFELSFQATVQSLEDSMRSMNGASSGLASWKLEQKRVGNNMLTEGLARLCLAQAEIIKEVSPVTLNIPTLKISSLPQIISDTVNPSTNAELAIQIVKLFEEWDLKATVGPFIDSSKSTITLEPAEPDAGA
ncbi:hypothetical protein T484DRAFT_1802483 [Baffinella frigidus]|nr:hypothetical protein T484DRAFT_1802483 [Cryptophyta sp. CCMP2293]